MSKSCPALCVGKVRGAEPPYPGPCTWPGSTGHRLGACRELSQNPAPWVGGLCWVTQAGASLGILDQPRATPPCPRDFSSTLCESAPLPTPSRKGNGTPLQYSCLENPMDGGAWWAAVHGVAKSLTQLSDFTFTFHFHALEKEMATHSSVLA